MSATLTANRPSEDAATTIEDGWAHDVLARLAARRRITCPTAIVSAHPDDESIGLGGVAATFQNLTLLQMTDGAPLDPAAAERAGYPSRRAYADARRGELIDALQAITKSLTRLSFFEVPDGSLADHLDVVVERLASALLHVEVVFTHPFEGGHIDHDATAFAVQLACGRLAQAGGHVPARLEFTSYHRHRGLVRSGRFLDDPDTPEIMVPLTPEAAWRKEAAFACHRSQEGNLRFFGYGPERFRRAPVYDFTRPPNGGDAMYGTADWERLSRAIAAVTA